MLPIHFAPLQGYTDDAYRRAHNALGGGVASYCTPFIRIEKGAVRPKDRFDARPEYNPDVPLVLQAIAADDAELRLITATIIEMCDSARADGTAAGTWADPKSRIRVDLNMGCPFPLQVRHGRGAGLLANTGAVRAIARVISQTPSLDFSVKMRLGVDDRETWREILPILNDTPLMHITLHPRIATQQYKGETDMAAFEAFVAQCRHPLVYNGDITAVQHIHDLEAQYPTLAGVMIGRGLLARPTLAAEYLSGKTLANAEVIATMRRIHDAVQADLARRIPGEAALLARMRTFWDYAEPTLGRKVWKRLHKAGSMRRYLEALAAL